VTSPRVLTLICGVKYRALLGQRCPAILIAGVLGLGLQSRMQIGK